MGLYRPHTPYVAPKKYFEMYPRRDRSRCRRCPAATSTHSPNRPESRSPERRSKSTCKDDLARQAIQAYYASITFADAQLGRILDALDEIGALAENTIVLFTSDHGYHMGEHGPLSEDDAVRERHARAADHCRPGHPAGQGGRDDGRDGRLLSHARRACGLEAPQYAAGVSLAAALARSLRDPTQLGADAIRRRLQHSHTAISLHRMGRRCLAGTRTLRPQNRPAEMVNLAQDASRAATVAELSTILRQRIATANQAPKGIKQVRFETAAKYLSGK